MLPGEAPPRQLSSSSTRRLKRLPYVRDAVVFRQPFVDFSNDQQIERAPILAQTLSTKSWFLAKRLPGLSSSGNGRMVRRDRVEIPEVRHCAAKLPTRAQRASASMRRTCRSSTAGSWSPATAVVSNPRPEYCSEKTEADASASR
jgi:hypothetical protein